MIEKEVRVWRKGYFRVNKEGVRIWIKGKYIKKKLQFPKFESSTNCEKAKIK